MIVLGWAEWEHSGLLSQQSISDKSARIVKGQWPTRKWVSMVYDGVKGRMHWNFTANNISSGEYIWIIFITTSLRWNCRWDLDGGNYPKLLSFSGCWIIVVGFAQWFNGDLPLVNGGLMVIYGGLMVINGDLPLGNVHSWIWGCIQWILMVGYYLKREKLRKIFLYQIQVISNNKEGLHNYIISLLNCLVLWLAVVQLTTVSSLVAEFTRYARIVGLLA